MPGTSGRTDTGQESAEPGPGVETAELDLREIRTTTISVTIPAVADEDDLDESDVVQDDDATASTALEPDDDGRPAAPADTTSIDTSPLDIGSLDGPAAALPPSTLGDAEPADVIPSAGAERAEDADAPGDADVPDDTGERREADEPAEAAVPETTEEADRPEHSAPRDDAGAADTGSRALPAETSAPPPAVAAETAHAPAARGPVRTTRTGAHAARSGGTDARPDARVDARQAHTAETPAPRAANPARSATGAPESSVSLTADRLLEARSVRKPPPTGPWHRFVYSATGHAVNLGAGRKEREEAELTRRIAKPLTGSARFVPVLTRKGGVGKTTVALLLGMALADARDDRVIAVDANPDRGTLAERVRGSSDFTVRDVIDRSEGIDGYTELSTLVARDATRLDVLASDTDPHLSEAFDAEDYAAIARLAARYYSLVLTDCGTGIVHSVMRATLGHADSVVIVSGSGIDEVRLASETLSWLEANGYEHLARSAIVALNTSSQASKLVKLDEVEAHFRSRVRGVARIPFDPQLAQGAAVSYADLRPATRAAARELAALVVEGLPSSRSASARTTA